MAVLTIRSHRRFALRKSVRIGKDNLDTSTGLLIELSSEGCRVSSVERGIFQIGDAVVLDIDDRRMGGRIRWSHDGIVGVRFNTALFNREIEEIVSRDRAQMDLPRYGT